MKTYYSGYNFVMFTIFNLSDAYFQVQIRSCFYVFILKVQYVPTMEKIPNCYPEFIQLRIF